MAFPVMLAVQGGMMALSWIDRHWIRRGKKERFRWSSIEELRIQTSRVGIGIPEIFGTYKVAGNIIWIRKDGLRFDEGHENEQAAVNLAIGICAGPCDKLLRVWANDVLVLDLRNVEEPYNAMNQICTAWRWYPGDELQEEDPLIKADMSRLDGFGDPYPFFTPVVPAHRGMSYMVIEELGLTGTFTNETLQFGGTIPNFTFEIAKSVTELVPFDPLFLVDPLTVPVESPAFTGQIHTFTGFELGLKEFTDGVNENLLDFLDGATFPFFVHGSGEAGLKSLFWRCDGVAKYVGVQPPDTPVPNIAGTFGSTNAYFSFWVYSSFTSSTTGVGCLCQMTSTGGTQIMAATVTNTGLVQLRDQDNNVIGTSTTQLREGVFERIDIHHNSSTTDYELKINGNLEFAVNANVVPTAIGIIRFGEFDISLGTNFAFAVDDVVGVTGDWFPHGDDGAYFVYAPPAVGGYNSNTVLDECSPESSSGILAPFWRALISDDDCLTHFKAASNGHVGLVFQAPPHRFETVYAIKSSIVGSKDGAVGAPYILTRWRKDALAELSDQSDNGGFPGSGDFAGKSMVYPRKLEFNAATGDAWTYDDLVSQNVEDTHGSYEYPALGPVCAVEVIGSASSASGTRITKIHLDILHGTMATAEAEEPAGPDDWIVYGGLSRFIFQQFGEWDIWNAVTNTLEYKRIFRIGTVQTVPVAGCGFDVDDQNMVWTTQWTVNEADHTEAKLVKLDGETLDIVQIQGTKLLHAPTEIASYKDGAAFRFIFVMEDEGQAIQHFHNQGAVIKWVLSLVPQAGFRFVTMDLSSAGYGTGRVPVLVALEIGTDSLTSGETFIRWHETERFFSPPVRFDISTEFTNPIVVLYHATKNVVMVGQKTPVEQVGFYQVTLSDVDRPTFELLEVITGEVVPPRPWSAWHRGFFNGGLIYAWEENILHRLSIDSRSITDTWLCINGADSDPVTPTWLGGSAYDVDGHSVFTGCDFAEISYLRVYLDRADTFPALLGDVVETICEEAGLPAAEIDVTELTDFLYGYALTNRIEASNAIEPLAGAYFFDVVDSSGKLKFLKRGRASVLTLTEADLAAHEYGAERPQLLISTRQSDTELPNMLEVTFVDYQNEYEQGLRHDIRQTTYSTEAFPVDLPLCLTGAEAQEISTKRLVYAWVQRVRHRASLPPKFLWLDPADVVTIVENDTTHVVRIDDLALNGRVIDIEATNEAQELYTAPGTDDDPLYESRPLAWPGPMSMAIVDIGPLLGAENRNGVYAVPIAYSQSWDGGNMAVSRDGGGSYLGARNAIARGVVAKMAEPVLADVEDPFVWDEVGEVIAYPTTADFAPASATAAQVLAGANRAVVGDELIGFQNVTANVDGTFTLSRLLRGRRGTDWATGSHAEGERIILVSGLVFIPLETDDRGTTVTFRALASRGSSQFTEVNHDVEMRHLIPLSPTHITGVRDGSGNLTISWIRRDRGRSLGTGGTEAPFSETTEAYEVDIYNGSTFARTLTAATTSVVYSAAQQATDGFALLEPVDVGVVQLSAEVGRGRVTFATV